VCGKDLLQCVALSKKFGGKVFVYLFRFISQTVIEQLVIFTLHRVKIFARLQPTPSNKTSFQIKLWCCADPIVFSVSVKKTWSAFKAVSISVTRLSIIYSAHLHLQSAVYQLAHGVFSDVDVSGVEEGQYTEHGVTTEVTEVQVDLSTRSVVLETSSQRLTVRR
jgi:hypothetical protein